MQTFAPRSMGLVSMAPHPAKQLGLTIPPGLLSIAGVALQNGAIEV
jgi:hypothetical protein